MQNDFGRLMHSMRNVPGIKGSGDLWDGTNPKRNLHKKVSTGPGADMQNYGAH
jgi:hypothetical protein